MVSSILILIVLLIVMMAIGVPVAFSMGASSLALIIFALHSSPMIVVNGMVGAIDRWVWVAVPLFVLLGGMMNETGIMDRLVKFAVSLVGHIHGTLSHVVVLTHTMMAGMSGSMLADSTAVGAMMIPAMKKAGYSDGYAAAIVSAGGIIGPLIPPSIPLILIGALSNTSILRLWLGGIMPGLIVCITLLIMGYFRCKGKNFPISGRASWKDRGHNMLISLPALLVPVLILGGMRLGWFTAVEGAASGILYIIIVAIAFYNWRNVRGFGRVLSQSVKTSAAVLLLIATGVTFGQVLCRLDAGPLISEFLLTVTKSPTSFLLMVGLVFLVLGCFIEGPALTLMFVLMLMTPVNDYGVDPVQFGVLFAYVTMVGSLTPPVGNTMFAVLYIADTNIFEYVKGVYPFLIALVVLGILIIFVPQIVLFLPNLIMGVPVS